MKMIVGGLYNWQYQKERLVYLGKDGAWYQFDLVEKPLTVWCEVLEEDLQLMEESSPEFEECSNDVFAVFGGFTQVPMEH